MPEIHVNCAKPRSVNCHQQSCGDSLPAWQKLPPPLQPAGHSQWSDWRWQTRNCITDPETLAGFFDADPAGIAAMRRTVTHYPLRVTPYFLTLADSWSTADPIARQFLPAARELTDHGLCADGLGESGDSPMPGVIHRYPDRVLLLVTGECATFCRHCFRKRHWAGRADPDLDWDAAATYIAERPQVSEVILSGGDALMLADDILFNAIRRVSRISHVTAVRLASRLPAVLPQRFTGSFCENLTRSGPVWLMTQFNHPRELTHEAQEACGHLLSNGIPVLNQTVLLKGVNDCAQILEELFRGLVSFRVKPHYLFHGDPVAGTGHFRTGIDCGRRIMAELRTRLSGLALPTFAIDLPNGGGKVQLAADCQVGQTTNGEPVFRSFDGRDIAYS